MKHAFRAAILAIAVAFTMTTAAVVPAVAIGPPEIDFDKVLSIAVKHTKWSQPVPGGNIELRYGNYEGTQYGWARIDGAGFPHGIVTLERSWDAGVTWYESGRVSTTARNFTYGYRTSPDWRHLMKACWETGGQETCTSTW